MSIPSRIGRSASRPWAVLAAIVLAGAAAYSNSLHGAFVFDDPFSIADNESIRSLRRLDEVLLPVAELDYYRPVLNLSLAVAAHSSFHCPRSKGAGLMSAACSRRGGPTVGAAPRAGPLRSWSGVS